MKVLKIISVWMVCLFIVGCYYDVEETLYQTTECSSENMSYVNDIVPLLDKYCMVCHQQGVNFGNVTLEGYETLQTYVDNGSFLGAIKHEDGYTPMPQSGEVLLDCEIEKIESWVLDGALNN